MDTNLAELPRYFASEPSVSRIQAFIGKTEWTERPFAAMTTVLVFNGGGTIWVDDRDYTYATPFVLLGRPGRHYRFGPENLWDEYHFCFDESSLDSSTFDRFPDAPWPVRSIETVRGHIILIKKMLRYPTEPGLADQLDLLTRLLLITTLHGINDDPNADPAQRLQDAREWLSINFQEDFCLRNVAKQFGFSESTFRRIWREHFEMPPWQHVMELRLQEGLRLLRCCQHLRINEIAARCGFSNQRRFASLIKESTGRTPTEIRDQSDPDANRLAC